MTKQPWRDTQEERVRMAVNWRALETHCPVSCGSEEREPGGLQGQQEGTVMQGTKELHHQS